MQFFPHEISVETFGHDLNKNMFIIARFSYELHISFIY